jgi:hypothetical protein
LVVVTCVPPQANGSKPLIITTRNGLSLGRFVGTELQRLTSSSYVTNSENTSLPSLTILFANSVVSEIVSWEGSATPLADMYNCYEDSIWKYSFGIRQDFTASADYWHPNGEAVFLDVGARIGLQFELYYTGEPNTAETFTMATSFYGRQSSTINAVVSVEPDTLNLKSQGKWVACYIELPEGYDVNDIDFSSIKLNDTIAIDYSAPIIVDDHDNDGITDLNVKFDRSCVIEWLEATDCSRDGINDYDVTFEVTGEITEATFVGCDIIKFTYTPE